MKFDRTAKFGTIGAIGVILVSLGMFGLSRVVWDGWITGNEGMALGNIMFIGTSSHSELKEYLLVSTTDRVAQSAEQSVLIARS